jgi:hypothetical protein
VKNNTASTLTRTGEGTADDEFTLRTPDAAVARYFGFHPDIPTPGRLKSFADRYGSGCTLSWFAVGGLSRLASFTDSYGRVVTYRYYGAEKNHQVREIEDFLGRKLNFQYDDEARLTAIVTPSILKAAEGNTFPDGTAYVFQYDVENPRPERRGDLVRAWWPNEATPFIRESAREVDVEAIYAKAQPRYTVEYGQDPTDLDTWGKVTAETVGDPKSGVGGTYRFIHTTSDLPANGIDPEDPIVKRTIVTDRNGNQQVYDFNAKNMPVRNSGDVDRIRSLAGVNSISVTRIPEITPGGIDAMAPLPCACRRRQPERHALTSARLRT